MLWGCPGSAGWWLLLLLLLYLLLLPWATALVSGDFQGDPLTRLAVDADSALRFLFGWSISMFGSPGGPSTGLGVLMTCVNSKERTFQKLKVGASELSQATFKSYTVSFLPHCIDETIHRINSDFRRGEIDSALNESNSKDFAAIFNVLREFSSHKFSLQNQKLVSGNQENVSFFWAGSSKSHGYLMFPYFGNANTWIFFFL